MAERFIYEASAIFRFFPPCGNIFHSAENRRKNRHLDCISHFVIVQVSPNDKGESEIKNAQNTAPCARKGQPHFLNKNEAFLCRFSYFWTVKKASRKAVVLLDSLPIIFYILNQISHLTIQERTDCVYRFP